MKKVVGTRIDSVAVTEVYAVPSAEDSTLGVTIGFHDMKANQTLAHEKFTDIWSENTFKALRRLYECIEEDVVNHVSPDGAVFEETDGTGTSGGLFPDQK